MSGENVASDAACALPMPPHRITWLLEQESVKGVFTCEAEPDGKCRLVCGTNCGAEQWPCGGGGVHDYDGEPHSMRDGGECNVVLFLTQGDNAESLFDGDPTEPRNGLIECRWDGDYYVWEYATAAPDADR